MGKLDFASLAKAALVDLNDPESHVEADPYRIHASQIGYCDRQAYTSKTGLQDQRDTLGVFHTGTMIHEFFEDEVGPRLDHVGFEVELALERDGIEFVGRADAWDTTADVVYDFKTRNGWYNHNPPTQRHLDQLYVYMAALDVDRGCIVYVNKGDLLDQRVWPEQGFVDLDEDRLDELVAKARRIGDAIAADGVAASPGEIPFDRCGCYFCDEESLTIEADADGEEQGVRRL